MGRIIPSTNTLPILSNLLLKTQNGLLVISSTNLEIAITTQIRCKVEEEGGVTVVSRTLSDLINNLPNKNLNLQTDGENLVVEAENYHTKIKTLPTDDFPLIPTLENGNSIQLDAQELKSSLDQVVFAASTNQTQPEISGILFAKAGGELRVVATDRYRLAEKKIALKETGAELQIIIPQKTVVELSRVIGNQSGNVEVVLNETQTGFNFNDTQIISRLIDGQYPDYREIIPQEFKTEAVIEKKGLVSALKAAAVMSQNSNSVKVDFSKANQQVKLTGESSELGKSEIELPAKIEGNDVTLVLNYHYLLDCLSSIDSESVVVKMIDDNSPSLIVPEEKKDYIYLIMPIKS